jgi:hypothetical protein
VAQVRAIKMETMTLEEMLGFLSENIRRVRDGETTPANANAITNASGKILAVVKLQMEYQRLTGRQMNIPLLAAGEKDDDG